MHGHTTAARRCRVCDERSNVPRYPRTSARSVSPVEIRQLRVDQIRAVRAGRAARPLERHDALDFIQAEPKPSRLSDERQHRQRLRAVDAVARGRAARGRQDAGPLVQPERLPTRATFCGDFTDQQTVSCQGSSLNPVPWGKVKEIVGARLSRSANFAMLDAAQIDAWAPAPYKGA
jgi:hypothetical protein